VSFFENSKRYTEVSLIDIATLKRGYDLPVQNRVAGNVPIFAANGQNGTHNQVKKVGPGVVTGRSGTIGKVHYVNGEYWPLNTSLYVTNFHGNHPRWVFYMLQAFKLERFVEGAGVPTLNRNLVHGEKIPLPPLNEQKRIAAILDKADSLRRKRQQAIQLADQFLRSVFLDLFGDPLTWSKNNTSTDWEYLPIRKIAHLKRGYDLPVQNRHGEGVPVYAANGVVGFHNEEKVSGPGVITGRSGTLGTVMFSNESFWPLNTSLYVTDFCGNEPRYIQWFLKFYKLDRFHRGAGVPTLNRNLFLDEMSFVPPIEIQKKFVDIFNIVAAVHSKFNDYSDKNLFESLSQKAFAGEL